VKLRSAADIKYHREHHHQLPRPGSRLATLYDLFFAHKGEVVDVRLIEFPNVTKRAHCILRLRDVYGLDIRMVRQFHFMLVGEWCDNVYLDYLAERLEKGL
jgi:hypothetical protein